MKFPNIEEMLKKKPKDWQLFYWYSDWLSLYTPPDGNEIVWIEEGEMDYAVAFNEYFWKWKKLTPKQKEAVEEFSELMLGRGHGSLLKWYERGLQIDKECREYNAPLGTIDLEKEVW